MPDVRAAALSCLRDGRVRIVKALDPRVVAEVRSSRPEREAAYVVDRWNGDGVFEWLCTCSKGRDCPHVAAVALVTYPSESAARKP